MTCRVRDVPRAQYARRATPIVPAAERFVWWPEWAWPLAATLALSGAFGLFVRRSRQRREAQESEAVAAGFDADAPDKSKVKAS